MAKSITDEINAAYERQKAAELAKLKAQLDNQTADIDAATAKLPGTYATIKDNAAINKTMRQVSDNEYAAGTGLSSGAQAQQGIARQNVYGNALSAADTEMAGKIADYNLQKQKLNNQYTADANYAASNIDAQKSSALVNQMNTDRSFEEQQKATQINNFLQSIGAYSDDYQKQIDAVTNDGDPTNDWQLPYLGAARQDKIANQQAAQAAAAQQQFENQLAAAELELARQKANKSGGGGGGGSGGGSYSAPEATYGGYTRDEIVKMVQNGMLSKEDGTAILSKPDGAGGSSVSATASPTTTMSAGAKQAYTLLNSPSADGTPSQYTPAQKEQMLAIYLQRGAITEDEFIQLMQLSGLDPSKYMS